MTEPPDESGRVLSYDSSPRQRPDPAYSRGFYLGLFGGVIYTFIGFVLAINTIAAARPGLLVSVPAIKIIAAVTLLCFRRWRNLGVGLLVSIALNVLIVLTICGVASSHARW